jgi:hypothetical protein
MNQIIFHPDIAALFSAERSTTPYKRKQGFAWYLLKGAFIPSGTVFHLIK